jgi:outer membrane protein OmpA-like peptidoglycan-associated protein
MDSHHYKGDQQIDETGNWLSISDLMAGLLMVFALLLIVTLAQLFEFQEQSKSNRIIIVEEIQKGLDRVGIQSTIDTQGTLSLVEGLYFESGSAEINSEGREFLKKLIPVYSQAIFTNAETAEEVNYLIIEGHSDKAEGHSDKPKKDKHAMSLSIRRAEAVSNYIGSSPFHYKGKFIEKILPAGRGSHDASSELNPKENRKVIFRFEFKSHDLTELIKLEGKASEQ